MQQLKPANLAGGPTHSKFLLANLDGESLLDFRVNGF